MFPFRESPAIFDRRRGFTLIELLVVILIIAILLILLLPAIHAARAAAQKTVCENNIRQLGSACLLYEATNGRLPPGQHRTIYNAKSDEHIFSWFVEILPFIEQGLLREQLDLWKPISSPTNRPVTTQIIDTAICPSSPSRGNTVHPSRENGVIVSDLREEKTTDGLNDPVGLAVIDYMAVSGPHKSTLVSFSSPEREYGRDRGAFRSLKGTTKNSRPVKFKDITDGSSKTLAIIELAGQGFDDECNGIWAMGSNIGSVGRQIEGRDQPTINLEPKIAFSEEEPRSDHRGGVNAVFCDGHCKFLTDDLDVRVLRAIASISDNELNSDDSSF